MPRLGSNGEEIPERLSIEFGCVHCDRRDWGWGGSFIDRLPTSMQFTFSPAEDIKEMLLHNPARTTFPHSKSNADTTHRESRGYRC